MQVLRGAVWVCGLLAGCGGRVVEDRDDLRGIGGGMAGSVGSTGGAAAGTGGAAAETGGAAAETGGAAAELITSLSFHDVLANCAEPRADDPLELFYNVSYANLSDDRYSATVAESRLIVGNGTQSLTWTFEVDQSGPFLEPRGTIGSQVSQGYNKRDGTGRGTGQGHPCDYCDVSAILEVVIAARGETRLLTAPANRDTSPIPLRCTHD